MKISKQSWHYRFNNYVQDGFASRVRHDTFTTCSYIRTTIASAFTGLFKLFIIFMLSLFLATLVGSGVYLPFAVGFGLPLTEPFNVFGVIFWFFAVLLLAAYVYESFIKERLAERREKKLNVLRQAMADQKAGICTIVEFE